MFTELDIDAFMAQKTSFDLLIDARSPDEFDASHIPSAHNYFALSNEEHEEVGTLYKNVSRNDAKVLGAAYICHNAASHIQAIYAKHRIGSRIGIYCARGGLRSSSLALILSSIGYQVFKLRSGYKSYRNYVLSYLETFPHERFIVLGGNTGCGKTELLQHLSPSIDLEGLARHMGSSFGHVKGTQPTQKAFENALVEQLIAINANEAIFIEGESKRMGTITIPTVLHARMQKGFRVEITAPLEQRVSQILKDYINVDRSFFYQAMERISPYIKKSAKDEAIHAFESTDLNQVATILLIEYYDKVYKKPLNIDASFDNSHPSITMKNLLLLTY
jgi:tRNA 2-selenouridine synthase